MGLAFPSEVRHQQLTGPRPLRLDRSVSSQYSVPETERDTLTRRNRESNMRRGALKSVPQSARGGKGESRQTENSEPSPTPVSRIEDALLKQNHRGASVCHGEASSRMRFSDSLGFTVDGK